MARYKLVISEYTVVIYFQSFRCKIYARSEAEQASGHTRGGAGGSQLAMALA